MDGDLLPIGQFARLGRLSVKQLRHYDELGLLVPAWVDPVTGYRYYRASQARVALSIGLLRSLDVPLPVVGRVLEGDAGALEDVRAGLEAELARRRRTLASLERVMAGGLPAPEVSVARLPARRVLVAREVAGGPEGIGRATSAAVARVLAVSAGEGEVRLTGVFPVDLDGVVEVLVAREVPGGAWRGGAATETGAGVLAEVLAGGVFAAARHVGPYDQIPLTASAVLAWCGERRLVALEVREVYVSDPAVTAPDRLVTDVLVRFEAEE
ncbi:MerR family transcriptional regulator [Nonomuraea ferruginea]|uniref:MerR family DNA-binding transcriptional regulator n=1 Tax=Nonomuraea ferruginea TaxID=46174 RepID=A0ABT4T127_9ACTN|nr:MerR family DNA-binding transcriptional regulator [Nonomuraea ferruginea]MDA0643198.1 MerR family DNA-binding transcriptional regulator [Nonomuraea ferruginea]